MRKRAIAYIITWFIGTFWPLFYWLDKATYWLTAFLGELYSKYISSELRAYPYPSKFAAYYRKKMYKHKTKGGTLGEKLISRNLTYDILYPPKKKKGK